MRARGPKKLWRVSWSGGSKPFDEADSQYYSIEEHVNNKVKAAQEAGANVHVETTECEWQVLVHEWI